MDYRTLLWSTLECRIPCHLLYPPSRAQAYDLPREMSASPAKGQAISCGELLMIVCSWFFVFLRGKKMKTPCNGDFSGITPLIYVIFRIIRKEMIID